MKRVLLVLAATIGPCVFAEVSDGIGGNWFYLPEEGLLSNDVWSINVQVKDAAKRKLQVGRGAQGDAFTTRGGETLDFSGVVTTVPDGTGTYAAWKITAFAEQAFSSDSDTARALKTLIIPSTVETLGWRMMNGGKVSLTNLVFASDSFTGSSAGEVFYGQKSLHSITLDIPRATTLGAQWFRNADNKSLTVDFADWKLDRLTTISYNALFLTSPDKKLVGHTTGELNLPKVTLVQRRGVSCTGVTGLRLGTGYAAADKKTLTLGDSTDGRSFAGNKSLKSITMGAYADVAYLWASAKPEQCGKDFEGCDAIEDIRFLGAPLAHTEDFLDRALLSVPERTDGTKQVVIRASGIQGWRAFAKTDYSADELSAKAALEGTLAAGEVVMGVYQTTDGARKAWLVHAASPEDAKAYSFTCFDARQGASIQFLEGAPVDGVLKVGSRVKISAVCPDSEFVRWEGLPADAASYENASVAEFTVGYDPIHITLYSRPNWVYWPTEGILSNAFWSVNASAKDVARHKLKVGGSGIASAYTDRGEGILDLSGRVFELNEDGSPKQEWTVTEFTAQSFVPNETLGNGKLTMFIFPETVETIGGRLFSGEYNKYLALTNIVLVSRTFQGGIPYNLAYKLTSLTHITVKTPRATSIGSQTFRYAGAASLVVDFGTWDLAGVKTVSHNAFRFAVGTTGELDLPSVTTIERNALNTTGITSLLLGTNDAVVAGKTLTLGDNVDSMSFANCPSLESITIGCYSDVVYQNDNQREFTNDVAIARVRFLGKPLAHTEAFLDRMLLSVPGPAEDGTKQVVIRASGLLGWNRFADTNYTAEEVLAKAALEATLADRERVLGVYVSTDLTTHERVRKAWLVHVPSKYDPKGTILIVR